MSGNQKLFVYVVENEMLAEYSNLFIFEFIQFLAYFIFPLISSNNK